MAIVKADPEFRRTVLLVYVGVTALGVVLIVWGLPAIKDDLARRSPEEALTFLRTCLVVGFLPIFPMAYYAYRFARRVLSSGQFPPPRTKVLFDIQIVEGKSARRRAICLMIVGALLLIVGLAGTFYLPYLLGRLIE
jgi:hypothetical protein